MADYTINPCFTISKSENSSFLENRAKCSGVNKVSEIWSILTRVRTLKKSALWKDFSEREIIDRVLVEKEFPKENFLYGFALFTDKLLDSKAFEKYCISNGYDALQMAQQVVLAGKTAIFNTLEKGLYPVFGNRIGSMKDAILYSKKELYGEGEDDKSSSSLGELLALSSEKKVVSVNSLTSATPEVV